MHTRTKVLIATEIARSVGTQSSPSNDFRSVSISPVTEKPLATRVRLFTVLYSLPLHLYKSLVSLRAIREHGSRGDTRNLRVKPKECAPKESAPRFIRLQHYLLGALSLSSYVPVTREYISIVRKKEKKKKHEITDERNQERKKSGSIDEGDERRIDRASLRGPRR